MPRESAYEASYEIESLVLNTWLENWIRIVLMLFTSVNAMCGYCHVEALLPAVAAIVSSTVEVGVPLMMFRSE